MSEDVRAIWAAEPVIAPFRSLLEKTKYSGPRALDEFAADSMESWRSVRWETPELREIDPERVLMLAELVGVARQTGMETRARLAVLFVVREGRIAECRTYASEQDALSAVTG